MHIPKKSSTFAVVIVEDLHKAVLESVCLYEQTQVCALVDEHVAHRWQQMVSLDIPTLIVHGGEDIKSIEGLEQVWDFLLAHHITRRGLLICVGGGSITDLGGFAAATYKRGIDCIHIPTTLLSMVDAATGGKTGINYKGMKNILGTFHTPVATLIDPEWLSTLPTEQLLSGFGEMLKNAILSDETEWNKLLAYDLDTLDTRSLVPHISSSIAIKEAIVATDPHEEGLRKALNFGHTFGHALEALSEGQIAHGYAVVYGMIAELYLSVTLLDCPKEPLQQMTQLMLHYYGRPQCNCKDRERLMTLMQQDKKNERAAEINCTLLHKIGEPIINQVITQEQVAEALDYLFSL